MGLLELDLPPLQLHASTQTDIRTPEKARFLQDAGFSQMVLARERDALADRGHRRRGAAGHAGFFVHGALCVAYSGQCFISHAHTGRSANRGNCSQECRLPYTVTDAAAASSRTTSTCSLKDNDQSANLAALVDAGIRSFKIEGPLQGHGHRQERDGHYRRLLDALLEQRPELARVSSGRCRYTFRPDPARNFNRGGTDYFVNGRQDDIGAFDAQSIAGLALGHVTKTTREHFEIELDDAAEALHNGDAHLGRPAGRAAGRAGERRHAAGRRAWRVEPNAEMAALKDLRRGTAISRNRDMAWERLLAKKSAERRIGVDLRWSVTAGGFALDAIDEDGHHARRGPARPRAGARCRQADAGLREQLGKLGATIFEARSIIALPQRSLFVPAAAGQRACAARRSSRSKPRAPRPGAAAARAAGAAAGALSGRHAELPRQRLQRQGGGLLRRTA